VVNKLCYIEVVRRANPDVLLNGSSEGIPTDMLRTDVAACPAEVVPHLWTCEQEAVVDNDGIHDCRYRFDRHQQYM